MKLVLMMLAVAGCSAPGAGDAEAAAWYLTGTFTSERTEEDMAAVCEAATGNRTCAFMESFPEQYRFEFPTERACQRARTQVALVPHTIVGDCRESAPLA